MMNTRILIGLAFSLSATVACGDSGTGGAGGSGAGSSDGGDSQGGDTSSGAQAQGAGPQGGQAQGAGPQGGEAQGAGPQGGQAQGGAAQGGNGQGGQGGGTTAGLDGEHCADDSECGGGFCFTEADTGIPGGMCAEDCTASGTCASAGSNCIETQSGDSFCFRECDAATPGSCGAPLTLECFELAPNDVCVGSCSADTDCTVAGNVCRADQTCGAPVPAAWTCDPAYYGDTFCDCGCGVIDSDCADATVGSCEYCDDTGSCSTGACPGDIDATDNSTCDIPVVPPGWTCNPDYYGDTLCDCGCGVIDSDCADATVGSCEYCDDTGSCSTGACPGDIDPIDNATCQITVVPPGWTCNPDYYGDTLCDCGCGAFDTLDCADATVASCEYCDDIGSCSATACPGDIAPVNNATCI
jgi:hypothetical protein